MPNPVVHWEIEARDASKLQEFYKSLFDWHIDSDNPMNYGFVETHGEGGINGGIPAVEETPRVTVFVQVADPQAALDRAISMGAALVQPVTELPMVTVAKFRDPEGNVVGLVKEEEGQP